MKAKQHILKIVILILITTILCSSTPTTRYLEHHPIEQLIEHFEEEEYPIQKFLPQFYEIIEREEEEGFFGYHASTMDFRIFQDILKVTHEALDGEQLPANFYHFRVPGDPLFDLPNGKETFLARHMSSDLSLEQKRLAIKEFILKPLNIFEMDDEEIDTYWAYFYGIRKLLMDEKTRLQKKYKLQFTDVNMLIQTLIAKKKMGYTTPGANDMLVSFTQPIAKIHNQDPVHVSQVLAFDNFLVNFCECESSELKWSIFKFLHPILDTYGEQQAQLMAVNIPLFGNYERWDECSINIFFDNITIEGGDRKLKELLRDYYHELGLEPEIVDQLWQVARTKLEEAQVKTGVLYQLYHLGDLDHDAFVSIDFGVPVFELQARETVAKEKLPKNKNNVDLQIRLVMNNGTTLIPEGGLRAHRYDNTPPEVSENILEEMRRLLCPTP